jgi:hypothetical protein
VTPCIRPAVLLLLAACAAQEPAGPDAIAVETWSFSMRGDGIGGSCSSRGTLLISQPPSDTAFTAIVRQSGSCGGGGTIGHLWRDRFPAVLAITGTEVGGTISFDAAPCWYHGTVFHTPVDSIGGMVWCTGAQGDSPAHFYVEGTWSAVKKSP